MIEQLLRPLHMDDMHLLARLRELSHHRRKPHASQTRELSLGDRVSDAVASAVGSWTFIIVQSCLMALWIGFNVTAYIEQWDPYPFILLNLVLSFQAAYTAPVIMMSQNRQATIDRDAARLDYDINLKSELEIELLHHKLDVLREKELADLIVVVRGLELQLRMARGGPVDET